MPTGSIGSMTASNEIATERRGTAPPSSRQAA